jgi:hypothetical protein
MRAHVEGQDAVFRQRVTDDVDRVMRDEASHRGPERALKALGMRARDVGAPLALARSPGCVCASDASDASRSPTTSCAITTFGSASTGSTSIDSSGTSPIHASYSTSTTS